MVDHRANAGLEHDIVYYFIHPETGEITQVVTHWLPAINFVEIWDHNEDLLVAPDFTTLFFDVFVSPDEASEADLELQISADIVQLPDSDEVDTALAPTTTVPTSRVPCPSR
jgi:hypothetical protein